MDFNPVIEASHRRCIEMGLHRDIPRPLSILKGNRLERLLCQNENLVNIALPFMNLLYQFLKGSGFLIDLTDKDGYILSMIGDDNVVELSQNMGMHVGTDMSERSCGTNSIGTCLHENRPVQMAGKQHFIEIFHIWTCSSSPIRDTDGNIIGCLNMTGLHNLVHPHTLGLVFAAVESIENEFRIRRSEDELLQLHQYNQTIINTIDYGILLVDSKGRIRSANGKALDIFSLREDGLVGKKMENIIEDWNDIFTSTEKIGSCSNIECTHVSGNRKKSFSLSVYTIGGSTSAVVMLRDIKNVYELVNKFSGKNAYYTFDDIIGHSQQLQEVVEYSKMISNTPSTVLIQGESGTGKEILAQAIHNMSSRREEAFIAINCGGIPRNLIESELFGYEDGAFTGAKKGGMPGKFELANGGTIFLDEIGEMPVDMQVNLLRVLQEKCITRVGGTRCMPIDVRVIAATNKDLIDEIRKGSFRQDLYYRLSVIPIHLPPLRERKTDIGLLVDHFLENKSQRLGIKAPVISSSDYDLLVNYSWPGNVRELENRIENIVVNGGLPAEFYRLCSDNMQEEATLCSQYEYNMQSLAEWEKIAIHDCLERCEGNITKTAKTLEIDRSTLYKKLKTIKNK